MLREADTLLTVAETALRLRQSEEVVRRKIRQGTIPALRLGDGPRAPVRVSSRDLEEWLTRSEDDR